METTPSFIAPDILITVSKEQYFPSDEGPEAMELFIDLKPYFPEVCCFEIVAVQSVRWHRSKGVFIDHDRTGINYAFDNQHSHWDSEDASDTLEYVVRDHSSGQTATAKITVQRIAAAHFEAADMHLMLPLDDLMPSGRRASPFELHLNQFNKFEDVEVLEVGVYNTKLFRSIAFDTERAATLMLTFETNCNPWHHGLRTSFDYSIRARVDGDLGVAKGTIHFEAYFRGFYAELFSVELADPLPAELLIDVAERNDNFSDISLIAVGSTIEERGEVVYTEGMEITYVPNLTSGFWDADDATDVISYTLRNNITDQEASNYISIEKAEPEEE